jgi:death-on-curing family protein
MCQADIIISNEVIKSEYIRCRTQFAVNDPYDSHDTMGILDVLRAHFLIADYFYGQDYGLGGIGPRDQNLLHSAVYRQFVSFDGNDKWSDPYQRCATLVFGIVKDHPFHDANKRTGLLVLLYFLTKMKRVPTVKQKELERFIVEIADGSIKKYRQYAEIKRRGDDPEVLFISDYIKRKSRRQDNEFHTVTFQELDTILMRFGLYMSNPYGNYIDVVKTESKRTILGFGRKKDFQTRILQIGFPGWKKQVDKKTITSIRKSAGLTSEKGIDSAAFFSGVDPLYSLIDEYSGPLQRLADR